jgi:hypothetical protein
MPTLLSGPLRRLSRAMADLRERVRLALAGEVARVVADAVREVVAAALKGDPPPAGDTPARRPHHPDPWREDDVDPWDDRPDWRDGEYDRDAAVEEEDVQPVAAPINPTPAAPAAVAVGVAAGRWWLRRRGSVLEAVGIGPVVAVAVLAGGPLVRTSAAVVSAAADLSAATDALGRSAGHISQI